MSINDYDYGNDIGPVEREILKDIRDRERKGVLRRLLDRSGKHSGSDPDKYQEHVGKNKPHGPVADIPPARRLPDE